MKIGIIGDIHSNLEALQAVLAACEDLAVDAYACIGDIVGYNANPHECLEIVRGLNLLGVVKGNHDAMAASEAPVIGFNPLAARAVEWTRSQLTDEDREWLEKLPYTVSCRVPDYGQFLLTHGTLDSPSNWGYIFDRYSAEASFVYQHFYQVCFLGHTHVPCYFMKTSSVMGAYYSELALEGGAQYQINVGSVGQPRDGNPNASFAVFSTEDQKVTLHRVKYDILTAQDKILGAGLPERLAIRLEQGK